MAVKVTEVPAATELLGETDIETLATALITVSVSGFEVAGLPVTQVAFEVITQVITALLSEGADKDGENV